MGEGHSPAPAAAAARALCRRLSPRIQQFRIKRYLLQFAFGRDRHFGDEFKRGSIPARAASIPWCGDRFVARINQKLKKGVPPGNLGARHGLM